MNYKIDLSMLEDERRNVVSRQIIDIAVEEGDVRRPKECIGKKWLFIYSDCIRYSRYKRKVFDKKDMPEITWQDFITKHSPSQPAINTVSKEIPKYFKMDLSDCSEEELKRRWEFIAEYVDLVYEVNYTHKYLAIDDEPGGGSEEPWFKKCLEPEITWDYFINVWAPDKRQKKQRGVSGEPPTKEVKVTASYADKKIRRIMEENKNILQRDEEGMKEKCRSQVPLSRPIIRPSYNHRAEALKVREQRKPITVHNGSIKYTLVYMPSEKPCCIQHSKRNL